MSNRIMVFACAMLLACVSTALDIGQPPEDISFKDIRYLPRTLDDFGERDAHVLLFHQASDADALARLDALAEARSEANVTVAALDQCTERNILELADDALEAGASYTVLKDYDSVAAKSFGIEALPAAVVLDNGHALRYRGPLSGAEAALDALLAGEGPAQAEVEIDGAALPDWQLPAADETPNFAEHIAPIINKHCYECHRPGQTGPFTLKTYKQVAHRADMIAEVVREGRMPPWYASDGHLEFMNGRRMSDEEILALRQWVAGGTPSGDLDKAPPAPYFPEDNWRIGTPDKILKAAFPFTTPATGFIPYDYIILPYIFPEETWIQGIEILPSNPAVVHHANLAFTDPTKPGGLQGNFNFLTGYVPGGQPVDIPGGAAIRIPKGALMGLQIHYVSTGKKEKNTMQVGLRYAKGMVVKELHNKIMDVPDLNIAPNQAKFPVENVWSVDRNAAIVGMFSHMHLRGRDMSVFARHPDGSEQTLLVVPNYSFDWQMGYELFPGSVVISKGSEIVTRSHYDNSAFNPYNPDPNQRITWGDQTVDEMNGFFMFYVDTDEWLTLVMDPDTGQVVKG